MTASLTDINKVLNEQTPLLERTASGTEYLVNHFKEQSRNRLDELERQRETVRRARSDVSVPTQTTNNQLSGLGGILAAPLVGIGAALAGGGALLSGLGTAGAGIGAFFLELAAAEAIMSKFGNGENLKALLTNLAGGLEAFGTQQILALGGLFAGSALFGTVAGPLGSARAGFGIAAIGAGVAAFFSALAAGDMAIEAMQATGASLKVFMTNLVEGLTAFTPESLTIIGGLIATGGIFGPGMIGPAVGMGAIGAGIAAFFTGLGAGDFALEAMHTQGFYLKSLMTNLAEGLSAFTPESLTIIGGLMATGGIFGPAMIGPAVGMGAIGTGIGLFFAGIAVGDAGISAINQLTGTQPGEGLKNLLINTADGIERFANIDIDPQKVDNLSNALGSISLAIVGFFGAEALGKLSGLAEELAAGLGGVLDTIFGTDFQGQARKGAIDRIIESLEPIKSLENSTIDKITQFGGAITGLADSFMSLANVRAEGISVNLERMLRGVGAILDAKEKLLYGGSYRPPSGGFLGRDDIRFGPEGEGGLANFTAQEYMTMRQGIEKLYAGLGISTGAAMAPAAPTTISSNVLQDLYVDNLVVREGLVTPNIIVNAPVTNQTTGTTGGGGASTAAPINPVDITNFLRQQALRN